MSNSAQAPYNPLIRKTGTQQGRALDAVAAAGVGQQNVGAFGRPLPGGVSIVTAGRGRSPVAHPFKAGRRNNSGVVKVEPGTINGKFAQSYEVEVGETGTIYVFVKVIPTFTVVETYVVSWEFDDFEIDSDFGAPEDTATEFYRVIAVYTNGVKVAQPVQNSLEVAWCGTEESPTARWGVSG